MVRTQETALSRYLRRSTVQTWFMLRVLWSGLQIPRSQDVLDPADLLAYLIWVSGYRIRQTAEQSCDKEGTQGS